MPLISEHISKNVKPSPTLMVETKARELRAKGLPIISLATGEPDFATPQNIRDAAIKAINENFTKYTPIGGVTELKQAIKNKFKRENNLEYELDEICVGSGAKQVIYNAFAATLDFGDEVIVLAPYWVSYPDMVKISRGNPVIVELDPDNNFRLDAKKIAKSITPKTKWIILNAPNNPCGTLYSKNELQELAKVLESYPNVHVLTDDIYEHIIFGEKFYTLAEVAPNLKSRILTVNGLSKSYAMTGWRIGYAGGSKELIKSMTTMQSQSTSNPCSISQMAGIEALNGTQDFIPFAKDVYLKRRNHAQTILDNCAGLKCNLPHGAFYLFVDCRNLFGKTTKSNKTIKTSFDLAEYFLENANVAVVPGTAFGTEGFFRITFACKDEDIIEGCNRIKNACEELI